MAKILFQSQVPLTGIKKILHTIILSKIFNVFSIVIVVLAIPVTVFLAQQQQETRQRATTIPITVPQPSYSPPTAKLWVIPTTSTLPADQIGVFDIMLDPGKHMVSFVKITIPYTNSLLDTTLKTPCATSICTNVQSFPAILEGPTFTPGFISLSVSVGADPQKAVKAPTKVATLYLRAKPSFGIINDGTIQFLTSNNATQVLSIAPSDPATANVLASAIGAKVNIPPTCTPCSADVNRNGKVTNSDRKRVQNCIKKYSKNKCQRADVSQNGVIDSADLKCIESQLGQTCKTRPQLPEPQEE